MTGKGAYGLKERHLGRVRRGWPAAVLPPGARGAAEETAGFHRRGYALEFRVPYPLADRRPYVGSGRDLLIDLQNRSELDPEFCLVALANGQAVLTAPGEEFFKRVGLGGKTSRPRGAPHDDPDSPVQDQPARALRPARRSAASQPMLSRVSSTAGRFGGGGRCRLRHDRKSVRWAQSYELARRAAA